MSAAFEAHRFCFAPHTVGDTRLCHPLNRSIERNDLPWLFVRLPRVLSGGGVAPPLSLCRGHRRRARQLMRNCVVRTAPKSCRFQKRLAEQQDKTGKTRMWSYASSRWRAPVRHMWNAPHHFRWTSSNSPLHWRPTCSVAPRRRRHAPFVAAVIWDSTGCEAFRAGYPSVWGKCGAIRDTEHLSQRMSNPTSVSAATANSLIMSSRLWHEVENSHASSAQAVRVKAFVKR